MPLYEYHCENCGHRFEVIQKFSDQPIAVCPSCGQGPVEKLLSSPAIQFKGTGWYITDYARKGQSSTAGTGTGSGKNDGGGGSETADKPAAASSTTTTDSSKTESKTESKPAESSAKKN